MYYYALRSSEQYLALLESSKRRNQPHEVVSIAGGLAFLHGIGSHTRRLTIVDVDEEVLSFAQTMLTVILGVENLAELISILTGYRLDELRVPLKFSTPFDPAPVLDRILLDPRLRATWEATYGAITFDVAGNYGRIDDNKILFTGSDLTPKTFSWRFGEGNFADESTFLALQKRLASIPVELHCGRLEDLDFQPHDRSCLLVALVSNADSPLFTKRDVIFRAIRRKSRGSIHYLSWVRDILIENSDGVVLEERATPDVSAFRFPIYEWQSRRGEDIFPAARSFARYSSLHELEERRGHGEELVFTSIDTNDLMQVLPSFLDMAVPAFKRMVFLVRDRKNRERLHDALTREAVHESYSIEFIERKGEFLILCEMIGRLPPRSETSSSPNTRSEI